MIGGAVKSLELTAEVKQHIQQSGVRHKDGRPAIEALAKSLNRQLGRPEWEWKTMRTALRRLQRRQRKPGETAAQIKEEHFADPAFLKLPNNGQH